MIQGAEFSFDPFPELETERLLLRRISKQYAADMLRLRSDQLVMEYIERPRPASEQEVCDWVDSMDQRIAENESIAWMIIQKSDAHLVGTIGYWRMKKEHFRAELGYMMFPEFWGQGLMSEAMRPVLQFAFDHMQMHSIEADINPENLASARILERNGFVREAFFRENFYWKGKFLNSAIYSLLKSDFQ
ncbi:MAG: GNAT family N-acetyltransferase [Flavobacteriales bacterium]|nr:GNAT family N-acetyltransferase [Flavobacteriales bacterium]